MLYLKTNLSIADTLLSHQTAIMPQNLPGSTVGHSSNSWPSC